MIQFLEEPLFHKLVAERHLVRAMLQSVANDRLDEILRNLNDAVQVDKADLRLNVPELRNVPHRAALFRAEGRTERVNFAHAAQRSHFAFQLAGDRQASLAAEIIVCIVGFFALSLRVPRLRRDAEHLARAFAVARRDDRRVDIGIAVLVEIIVDRIRQRRPDGHAGLHQVRARAQMRNRPQELGAGLLFLERIIRRAAAKQLQAGRFQLDDVPLGRNDYAGCAQRAAQR